MHEHNRDGDGSPNHHDGDDSMMSMMAMMMAMCLGVILLVVVLPSLGMPLGLLVALAAGALMLVLHGRFMRHG